MSHDAFSLTTPIYYVNAAPHLGTAYTTIAADVITRYERMKGRAVSFVTGLDEHGQKVASTAESKHMTPQAWCDSMVPAFKNAWDMLDIRYTDFVRTTEPRHTKTVQQFWNDLFDKGFLYKSCYEGWYCVHEETYYTQSDIEFDENDVEVCPECHRPLQHSAGEENWFFKLSEFQDKLLAFYDEHPDFIRPVTRRNEVVSFVKSGLRDLSISRSTFSWGVPLTFDEGHVAYVWADALLSYVTGNGFADPSRPGDFERFWPPAYHIVGKDILRFHCVIWPAMLMAAGYPIAHCVFGHGFLLTKGEKMSKSRGNAMQPADLVRVFGSDAYRYYFMSDIQFGHDGSISLERMTQVYNADLANTWGNLCSRVFNMTQKYFDGRVPCVGGEGDGAGHGEGDGAGAGEPNNANAAAESADAAFVPSPEQDALLHDNPLRDLADKLLEKYDPAMEALDYMGAALAVQELASRVNLYVEQSAPWTLAKHAATQPHLKQVIYNSLEAIRLIALYLSPFMPRTSAEVYRRLELDINEVRNFEHESQWGMLPSGNKVEVGEALFPRLDISSLNLDDE